MRENSLYAPLPASKRRGEPARAPAFTVVLSTYNRSNILPFAIETARWQTCDDRELLVVGDAGIDDSEAVVVRFVDPRIRFINLRERLGDEWGLMAQGRSAVIPADADSGRRRVPLAARRIVPT
jgi:glycosyltransferase involved in cell wall biosynthesis